MREGEISAGQASSSIGAPVTGATNQREHFRYVIKGVPFEVRLSEGRTGTIMLKDLSLSGTCGMMCDPVQVGDFLIVEFDGRHRIEAQVLWVRRLLVGLKFTNRLTEAFLEHLHERCVDRAEAMRIATAESGAAAR